MNHGHQIGGASSVAVIAGAGTLPFAVADAVAKSGRRPVIFAMRGFCDPARLTGYPHHWFAVAQIGRLLRLLRKEGCQDLVFIGSLIRPALSEIRLDFGTVKVLPRVARALRGGDDHLLRSVGRFMEEQGFHLLGIRDVAPQLLVPTGDLTQIMPDKDAEKDIALGLSALHALSPFDVGQALVVIDSHITAIEDIEGTDGLLARVARLRSEGRIRARTGRGVLVKAPKLQQDMRFDLPTLGPRTIEGAAAAGLAGIAIAAGSSIMADPQHVVELADRARLFVRGVGP